MRRVIIILFLMVLGTNGTTKSCLKADIILIADTSGSVKGYENFMAEAINAFVKNFELHKIGVRIGIITFADEAKLRSKLISNKQILMSQADLIGKKVPDGGTKMSKALKMAMTELQQDRTRVIKIIILITDGDPDDDNEKATREVAKEILDKGILIYGIFVEGNPSKSEFLKSICSDGGIRIQRMNI